MRELDKVDNWIRIFLEKVGYDKWARVLSPNNKYSNLTSDIAESLNSVIIAIRELPICTMLESLRALIQKWSWRNTNIANSTLTRLTNKFEDILKDNYLYSINLTVHPINDVLFEVRNDDRKAIVDIGLRTCTCNRFQLDQLSCAHAIVVLQKANHDPYDYCSPYFTKEAMIHAYEETMFPVGHEDTWEVPENIKSMAPYPPQGRVRVGRQKKRYKASWEMNAKQREQIKCGSCNQYRHNKRTCQNPSLRLA
ncbi:uncharacterized protein LOC141707911 [Apium graveolens]|uniref:uncharacterized protein LOC141707911 n=1 Tax=Apium graveolens TaxID=4045 RepID=UPI003D7B919D